MTILRPTTIKARKRREFHGIALEANRVMRQGRKNQAQIAADSWLDEGYVSRLFSRGPIRAATL